MPNFPARDRDSSPGRARLAAVEWPVPSSDPDTSDVDGSWFEGSPRHSFIAYKGTRYASAPAPMAPRETARESSPPLAASHQLAYDVCDSPHALVVLVDLPGVASEHVSLSLGSQALYLKVSVPTPAPIRDEPRAGVPAGEYEVRVEVPASAYLTGPDTIDASLRNGLLRIRLSKSPGGARRIAIVTGE